MGPKPESSLKGRLRVEALALLQTVLRSEYLILGLTVLLFLVLSPLVPGLGSSANVLGLLAYILPVFVMAAGMTLVLIEGGIDLSHTSIVALASITGASLMTGSQGWTATLGGVALMLLVGTLAGALNGLVVAKSGRPPFIVTLGSMMLIGGFCVWKTQSKAVDGLPEVFLSLGQRLPLALAAAVALGLGLHLALVRSTWGRWLFATGQNREAARLSGVPVQAVVCSVYALSGFCAGLAAVLLTARLETGSPVLAKELLLDVIGATVVGGTSLFGGRGKIAWTLMGVGFLALIDNVLNLLNANNFTIMMIKGLVIIGAAALDTFRRRGGEHP